MFSLWDKTKKTIAVESKPFVPISVSCFDADITINFDGTYEGDLDKFEDALMNLDRSIHGYSGTQLWLLTRELRRNEK